MALRFKCPKCTAWHSELPDIGYDRPYYATGMTDEQKSLVFLTSDLCVIAETDFFIRCVLPVPIKGTGETFGWGVWSSLSEQNFLRYQSSYDEDMSDWDPMFGYLSNQLPDYPDTLLLKLSVQPRARGLRPLLTLEPTDHPLAIDQREGISLEDVLKLVGPFLAH